MEIHQLRYFLAVARERSFSRAAERAFVAQPSLSQQIQKLETEIGQPLFDRLPRGVTLTEAGLRLLPFAERILSELNNAKKALEDFGAEPAGTVTLGIIPTICPYVSQRILAEMAKRHPAVRLRIAEAVTESLIRGLEGGDIDCGIISSCQKNPGLIVQRWAVEPLWVGLPSTAPLAGEKSVTPSQLRAYPILLLDESHCLSRQVRAWCARNRLPIADELPPVQLATLLASVSAGKGAALVPAMAVDSERSRGCVFLPFRKLRPGRELNLVRNAVRYQTKAAAAVGTAARDLVLKMLKI